MALIADFLLGVGALSAAAYCLILSRRLQRFTQLESGMGGAIALLSVQVDDLTRALQRAQAAANDSSSTLEAKTKRAEDVAAQLELLLASMHDLPEPKAQQDGGRKLRVTRKRSSQDAPTDPLEAAQ